MSSGFRGRMRTSLSSGSEQDQSLIVQRFTGRMRTVRPADHREDENFHVQRIQRQDETLAHGSRYQRIVTTCKRRVTALRALAHRVTEAAADLGLEAVQPQLLQPAGAVQDSHNIG
jgi:hypothetical protein